MFETWSTPRLRRHSGCDHSSPLREALPAVQADDCGRIPSGRSALDATKSHSCRTCICPAILSVCSAWLCCSSSTNHALTSVSTVLRAVGEEWIASRIRIGGEGCVEGLRGGRRAAVEGLRRLLLERRLAFHGSVCCSLYRLMGDETEIRRRQNEPQQVRRRCRVWPREQREQESRAKLNTAERCWPLQVEGTRSATAAAGITSTYLTHAVS